MAVMLQQLLKAMVESKASDLHITSGVPPMVRIDGKLVGLKHPPLSPRNCVIAFLRMYRDKSLRRTGNLIFRLVYRGWLDSGVMYTCREALLREHFD